MKTLRGKVALVTGAASGIGRATACALAAEGVALAVCDTNTEGIEHLKSDLSGTTDVLGRRLDVSDRAAMRDFASEVHDRWPAVDILINCAGVFASGNALELSLEDWDWLIAANLLGPINTCHHFLPKMVERGKGGHVANITSIYAYWVSPCMAGYITTKFGLFGYSESLAEDLRAHGITVSTICPGIINTGLVGSMRIRNAPGTEAALRTALKAKYEHRNYGPERVAYAIVKAIRKEKQLVLVSPESRLTYVLERVSRRLSRFVGRRAGGRLFSINAQKTSIRER